MVSQDNPLLPLPAGERSLDRPLSDLAQSKPYGVTASDTTHLRDYLFVVLKRKWLILTLIVVVTSLVTLQMYRQPSIYEASTIIQIEPKKDSILQSGKEIVINTGGDKDPAYWNTQLKLLENPALARQVILSLDLHRDPNFFGAPGQTGIMASLRRLFYGEEKSATTAPAPENKKLEVVDAESVTADRLSAQDLAKLEPYEDALAANLTVEPMTGTNLVKLHYTHNNPELAQKIVNTYADTFVKNNADRQTVGTEQAEKVLAEKIAEYQHAIEVDERERYEFSSRNNIPFSIGPEKGMAGTNLEAERLAKLSAQLLDAENKRKNFESLYNAANNAANPNDIPEVAENKRIQTLRDKLDGLKQRRDELLVIYTLEWPEVKRVDAQIKMLEESLDKAPREVVATLKSRFMAAAAEENSLRQSYNAQRGTFSLQNQAELQLSVLNQKIETNRQYLQTLLQRQAELQNTATDSMKTNNVNVVQYSRSGTLVGPARKRNIIIAFLLSLGVGIGLAFLLDYLDDTLKSIEDVDRYIHLPALALIPASRSERSRLKGGPTSPAGPSDSTALALINDVRSPIAEAYRHLRTSLLLSSAGQPPKTILVTSSQPSEGKTTTVVNTAIMLAQTGAEVLIIDCDLRRPRLHTQFHISNQRGVTNYLSGESELDGLLQPYDKLPNLKLLTSGPIPPNPAELLGSDEMRKLLGLAVERFTHVIIDSPPAISFTDASILSTMVDGVVLVVHGGRSSRAVVRRAKQQLLDVGANIFGVVLNNVKLEATNYYYYAGYYSSYYSNDDADEPDAAASGAREAS